MTKNRGKFRSFHGGKDLCVIFISNAFPTGLIVDSDFDGDDTLPSKVWTSGWYVLEGEYLVLRSTSLVREVEWVLGWFNTLIRIFNALRTTSKIRVGAYFQIMCSIDSNVTCEWEILRFWESIS